MSEGRATHLELFGGTETSPVEDPYRVYKRLRDESPVLPVLAMGHPAWLVTRFDDVRAVLMRHVERVARRLRKHELRARGITLKIRYGDFETITRSTTLDEATDTTDDIWQAARGVFDKWAASHFRPVRLIGVSAGHLEGDASQLDLFPNAERERHSKLDLATDRIVEKFGSSAIRRASTTRRGRRN